jgi:uncharacterized protein
MAAEIGPRGLRTLDAIHLASAVVVEPVVGALHCDDRRPCEAAAAVGLPVESPGA